MPAKLTSRLAEVSDAPVIAIIYNEGIEDRVATFETELRTAEAIAEQLQARAATHPATVVERDGRVVGFAWTGEYRPRRAYAGVGEVSVYVARVARGQGVGRLALAVLIDAAEARGFWKLVSRIFPENVASRRLCAGLGFREVGVYRRHGRLDGTWKDCVIVERLLGSAADD
ncbi:MAG: N-acetyltransferase family protein [Chloroflexi bacterium]|nr:MAG: N-acetyltransferase family protein [Chloroflexota bacterium]